MNPFTSWFSSLRRALGASSPKEVRRPRGFRPGVESLEGREVLATFVVTATANSGGGSLRQAILDANTHANSGGVADKISFNIVGASRQIVLSSSLPDVTEAVVIDATTQPGSNGQPVVQLEGLALSQNGLVFRSHFGSTAKGLVFQGFAGDAVVVTGGGGHTITNNLIGTANRGNGGDGVSIEQSRDNTVSFNTIGGNNFAGIFIEGPGSTGNVVRGCKIGTDVIGTTAVPNGDDGVLIDDGASDNLIVNSLISGNGDDGIDLDFVDNNTVRGNLIGTDFSGSKDLGNDGDGVEVNGRGNVIGGPLAAHRNVISGNGDDGVDIGTSDTSDTTVQGNFIGTDANGTEDLGNFREGVEMSGPRNIIVGNVISGNDNGVLISGPDAVGNVVRGNKIGTDVTGTKNLGNGGDGVHVENGASGNVIGGPTVADRNVISANGDDGVEIDGSDGNVVQGNFLGTDKTGLKALGNSFGVFLDEAGDNVIKGNVISANTSEGVLVSGSGAGSLKNRIVNNKIGVGADGKKALGNDGTGVSIDGGALNLVKNNVIAHNQDEGVFISGDLSVGNTLSRNRIFANGEGIDLQGPTVNDDLDADAGPNGLQNVPVINSAVVTAGQTRVQGVLASRPNTTYRIEFFSNQGRTFLGTIKVTTGANGKVTFQFVVQKALAKGTAITATATNLSSGDTSEFSNAKAV